MEEIILKEILKKGRVGIWKKNHVAHDRVN
jgi:hypothetical protein